MLSPIVIDIIRLLQEPSRTLSPKLLALFMEITMKYNLRTTSLRVGFENLQRVKIPECTNDVEIITRRKEAYNDKDF